MCATPPLIYQHKLKFSCLQSSAAVNEGSRNPNTFSRTEEELLRNFKGLRNLYAVDECVGTGVFIPVTNPCLQEPAAGREPVPYAPRRRPGQGHGCRAGIPAEPHSHLSLGIATSALSPGHCHLSLAWPRAQLHCWNTCGATLPPGHHRTSQVSLSHQHPWAPLPPSSSCSWLGACPATSLCCSIKNPTCETFPALCMFQQGFQHPTPCLHCLQ